MEIRPSLNSSIDVMEGAIIRNAYLFFSMVKQQDVKGESEAVEDAEIVDDDVVLTIVLFDSFGFIAINARC